MITLYHDSRFGLARAAVFWGAKPHLYAEGLDLDPSLGVLGTRSVARLKAKVGGMAYIALADGTEAVLDAPQEVMARLTEGAAVEIEIIAEARREKSARARFIAAAEGAPRRLSPVISLKDRLVAQACLLLGYATVEDLSADDDATEALSDAMEAALDPSGPLDGGGYLSIERTRALIACDVDAAGGGDGMIHTAKNYAKACNERAIFDLGRRLRLSGLAGLVVVDLIGRRHDAERLRKLLLEGFADEAGGIIPGQVGKFGTLDFVRPWGMCPLIDADPDRRIAHRLLRDAAERARGEPGRVLALRAPTGALNILRSQLSGSLDPLAPMLRLEAAPKPEVLRA